MKKRDFVNVLDGVAEKMEIGAENWEKPIKGIKVDSRKVGRGDIFVAYKGVDVDGHDFIEDAIKKGAVAVVGEREINNLKVPYFEVRNARLAWAKMVANWYGNPEKKLKIIGVTGTDGKTTTAWLVYQILTSAGRRVGLVGTIGAMIAGREYDTGLHTTSPDPDVLWSLLNKMVKEGMEYVVLEATSHALAQRRFGEIEFEIGILTNIGRDHMELHKSMDAYMRAKGRMFKRSKIAVLNRNDKNFTFFRRMASGKVAAYNRKTEIQNVEYKYNRGEMWQRFEMNYLGHWIKVKSWLLGDYNLDNILAASKAALLLGVKEEELVEGIRKLKSLPGRFEIVRNNRGIKVVVDFAHTEQGLRAVLGLVERVKKEEAKIIVVFGCNGERDRGKRAPMGEAAVEMADRVIVTAEDPRRESMDEIFSDIERGCVKAGGELGEDFLREDDRGKAIKMAIDEAKRGDWVLVLGKGHEKSMNIGGVEEKWSDVKAVKRNLK